MGPTQIGYKMISKLRNKTKVVRKVMPKDQPSKVIVPKVTQLVKDGINVER